MTTYDVNYRYLKDLIEEAQDKAFNDMCDGTFAEWDSYRDYHYELLQELAKAYGEHSKSLYANALSFGAGTQKLNLGATINEVFTDFYNKACVFVVSQNQDYFFKKYIKYEFTLLDNDNE
jgi:hypothetical protein